MGRNDYQIIEGVYIIIFENHVGKEGLYARVECYRGHGHGSFEGER